MRLVSTTTLKKIVTITALVLVVPVCLFGQENSPYSRYGLGDLVPGKNIVNRGMGGVTAAFADFQSVNFNNPASYSNLKITTFDIGLDINSRTLKDVPAGTKYTSNNMLISYLQIGIPIINSQKSLEKNRGWGLTFGLQPISRVSYKIAQNVRDIDSVQFLNEGSGGAYYAFAGTGYRIKNLSVGVNFGYLFGTKDINNRKIFINDSLIYAKSNVQNRVTFGNIFYNLGAQYSILLKKGKNGFFSQYLKIGAYGNLKQKINAKIDSVYETFNYDALGATFRVDSVLQRNDIKGTIDYPSSFGVGVIYEKEGAWMLGVDYSQSKWGSYRFNGAQDYLTDSWMVNVGAQVTPNVKKATTERAPKSYRAGFNYGRDIMNITGAMPVWGVSVGAGFPIYRSRFSTQYTTINTTLEVGARGNKDNGIKENYFRIGVGFSLSDLWFRKYKYQ